MRVVLYHASSDPRLSWFAAMPAMFFVGGALFAKSIDNRPPLEVLRSRSRRIVVPVWAWSAMVFTAYTVAGVWGQVPKWGIPGFILPILPAVGARGQWYWTWMTLWYLTAYLLFMLIGIPLRKLQKRAPVWTLVVLAVPIVVSGVLRQPALGVPTGNLLFWVLGYYFHDRRDHLPSRQVCLGVAGASTVVALAYSGAVTGLAVVTTSVPFLNAAVGLAWVALTLALGPQINRAIKVHWFDYMIRWFQMRAMTIYLWHALAVGVIAEMARRHPAQLDQLGIRVFLALALTVVLTLALGWIEDFAAGRPMRVIAVRWAPAVDLRTASGSESIRTSLREV